MVELSGIEPESLYLHGHLSTCLAHPLFALYAIVEGQWAFPDISGDFSFSWMKYNLKNQVKGITALISSVFTHSFL